MSVDFDTSKFHEREDFLVLLAFRTQRERVTTYLETLGFTIADESDFAYLERDVSNTPWQSSDVTQVDFFLQGQPSSDPEAIDSLNFSYLLATLPESTIAIFATVLENFVIEFDGQIRHRGMPVNRQDISDILKRYTDELKAELADNPGTDFVARMVYEFSPRG